MQVLLYHKLEQSRIPNFDKIKVLLERGDFRSADVKKIADDYYRARLDRSNRLLFQFARCGEETYILALEWIEHHAYESSRFLKRGVTVDETKLPPLADTVPEPEDLVPLTYVNGKAHTFNILDKVLSFDDAQRGVFEVAPPLIIVGSAGSGKTALTLEKMKEAKGNVLYVTRSPYLADNSRDLYYGMNYENEEQDVSFLSFAEFLDSIRVPETREVTFREFSQWFDRHRTASGFKDAYQLFEEINGVITGSSADDAWLSKADYEALGIRQSIYAANERSKVHDLFRKYLEYLDKNNLHDVNVLSFEHQQLAEPTWDFVVVDEVQDFTNVQLHLVLSTLADPTQFILCGDSNQIVHPNFFSWAGLKRHFYDREFERADGAVGATDEMRVLTTNYRSSKQVTELANRILRLKTARFRSVDRESNYLVESNSNASGNVVLMPDTPQLVRELDSRTRKSTHFAVLVMHPEHKAQAKQRFNTPLVFSIQEAKGLEYDNIILYDFVSADADRFREIVRDVTPEQVQAGDLRYARARDKSDKSLDIFKFHINALYVAATRAVVNVYVVESAPRQRLFDLLGIELLKGALQLQEQKSSLADWQREARKLERQGKQEQADDVRQRILGLRETPWQALDRQRVGDLTARMRNGASKKELLLLFEYALLNRDEQRLLMLKQAGFRPARQPRESAQKMLVQKHFLPFTFKRTHAVRSAVDKYGVDHRDPFGFTPLMLAARFGSTSAAELLAEELDANPDLVNGAGLSAFQIMLSETSEDPRYAERAGSTLYPLLAPAAIAVMANERLAKLDGHKAEFMFFNLMVALFQRVAWRLGRHGAPGLKAGDLQAVLETLPRSVVPEFRTKRAYISSVLARNEVDRDTSPNRRLFKRTRYGCYILNPLLRVRIQGQWVPIYDLLDTSSLAAEPAGTADAALARRLILAAATTTAEGAAQRIGSKAR